MVPAAAGVIGMVECGPHASSPTRPRMVIGTSAPLGTTLDGVAQLAYEMLDPQTMAPRKPRRDGQFVP